MYTNLDKIVRSILLQKGLPIHYYLQFLKLSADCLRELTFESARVVNTVSLVVNPNDFSAPLPCDFVDWTKVGVPVGQKVQPIYEIDSINRLQAKLPDGETTTYTIPTTANEFPFEPGYLFLQNIDALGENTGRRFGISAADERNGFKIIRENGLIQFTETFVGCAPILEYISDGQCIDNATKVDPMSQAVIEAYDDWKFNMFSRGPMNATVMAFDVYKREMRKYRARKSDLTLTAIKQAVYRNYKQSPKT